MDIDGSSVPAGDVDQSLLLQFSCMNTSDRDELVAHMQVLLSPSISYNTASFFLDMSNWNLQAAIGSYLDYSVPPKLPSMSLIKSENNETAPGTCFEQSWTIQNCGWEPWPPGCWVSRADPGSPSVPVPALAPGQSTRVTLRLTPADPRGHFHLFTQRGEIIGDTLCAGAGPAELADRLAALPCPGHADTPSQPAPDDQMC